jgi:hypothetical protein
MSGEVGIVVLGAASGPRAEAFASALAKLGRPAAHFLSYAQFVESPERLATLLGPNGLLRFDTPDRDPADLAALYALGLEEAKRQRIATLEGEALAHAVTTKGLIGSPAQLAFGLARALAQAATIARTCGARLLAEPGDIAAAFDKSRASERLEVSGIPVARRLGDIADADELLERMSAACLRRVFIKLRYGASAAGMTAFALGPAGRMVAYTTATFGAQGELYATRAVRRLDDRRQIVRLIDDLAFLGLHVEAWLPKAGVSERTADLRVIVIGGKPVFNVMRMSRHPMTNLHLGGTRASPEPLRQRVGEAAWSAMIESCAAAARAFPSCFMLGIDAAILADDRSHAVFEVNAFGDHVKGVTFDGCTPQEWQILQYSRLAEAA